MSRDYPLGSFRDKWGQDPRFRYSFHRSAHVGIDRLDFRLQLSVGVSRTLAHLQPDALLGSSWDRSLGTAHLSARPTYVDERSGR
jgi:hypothetical protein